jgi:hypothetical protein
VCRVEREQNHGDCGRTTRRDARCQGREADHQEREPEHRVDVLSAWRQAQQALVQHYCQAGQRAQRAQPELGIRPPRQDPGLDQSRALISALDERVQIERAARDRVATVEHRPLQIVVRDQAGLDRWQVEHDAQGDREQSDRDVGFLAHPRPTLGRNVYFPRVAS